MFKSVTIAPVYKSGDQQTAANYRPISLLPIVSKIFEKSNCQAVKIILKRKLIFTKRASCLSFRPLSRRCFSICCEQHTLARDKGHTGLVFVDLSKTFDYVQHQKNDRRSV